MRIFSFDLALKSRASSRGCVRRDSPSPLPFAKARARSRKRGSCWPGPAVISSRRRRRAFKNTDPVKHFSRHRASSLPRARNFLEICWRLTISIGSRTVVRVRHAVCGSAVKGGLTAGYSQDNLGGKSVQLSHAETWRRRSMYLEPRAIAIDKRVWREERWDRSAARALGSYS
jgi:hypothetical protein